jgi:hypothetical protein
MVTIGLLNHALEIAVGLFAIKNISSNRNNHMMGSSGTDVDNDLLKKLKSIESGIENNSIQNAVFQLMPVNNKKRKANGSPIYTGFAVYAKDKADTSNTPQLNQDTHFCSNGNISRISA